MTITAEILESSAEWKRKPSFSIGCCSSKMQPDLCVGVYRYSQPYKLLEVFSYDEYQCFQSIRVSGSKLVIGFGEYVHFVDVVLNTVESAKLSGYFGELYTPDDFELDVEAFDVLVASCENLHRFEFSGRELWKTQQLGSDGVIVQDVVASHIFVSGEWDPPGGWEESVVCLSYGKVLSS